MKRFSYGLLSVAAMLISTQASVASEYQQLAQLESVVVTAIREDKSKREVPESVTSFNSMDIEEVSPSHPSEILNRAAGVYVNNLGGEGHMTAIRQPITTRGVYLYLEDGVPVRPTGFFNHNALYEVNIPLSGRLEVVKGPGSALYGSYAIGGIINSLSTPPPEDTEYTVNVELGSYGWKRTLLSAGGRSGVHSGIISLNITDNDGYREESDYSRASLNARWDINQDNLKIKTLLSYTEVDQSGVSSLEQDDYKNDTKKNRFQGNTAYRDVEALRLSSEFSWTLNSKELLSFIPFYRNNTTSMAPSWMVTYDPNERESQFESFGLLTKYRYNITDDVQLITGLDIDYSPSTYKEEAVNYTLIDDIYTGFDRLGSKNYDFEAEQTALSPYTQIEFKPIDKLITSIGIRYDFYKIDYDDKLTAADPESVFIPQLGRPVTHLRPEDQTVKLEELSSKFGLIYELADNYDLYFNYRQAFSIPSVGTLFRSGTTQNSDDLEPINADSYEIGLRGEINKQLNIELAYYDLQIEDDLVTVIEGFARNTFNAGETSHKGIEINLNGQLTDEFSYTFAFTKTKQEYESFSYTTSSFPFVNVDVSGNDVGKAPETIGNLTFAYAPIAIAGLRIEFEWEHLGEYFTDETNIETYEGHDLYNFRASYQVNDKLNVYTRIQNITDELYSTYTSSQVGDSDISYRPGMPRSLFVGLRSRF